MRELSSQLRDMGEIRGTGPSFTAQDRSRFLNALEFGYSAPSGFNGHAFTQPSPRLEANADLRRRRGARELQRARWRGPRPMKWGEGVGVRGALSVGRAGNKLDWMPMWRVLIGVNPLRLAMGELIRRHERADALARPSTAASTH